MPNMRLVFRVHAMKRMFQRDVSVEDVKIVLSSGVIIETYPADKPYPSRLILGFVGDRPIHIVAADNMDAGETIIITVYEPDPRLWEADFQRRK